MPFSADEIANAANAAIEYHYDTPKVRLQSIQNKPLLRRMMAAQKSFPGGLDNITVRAKGDYTTTVSGFNSDDTVSYANPTNIKKATYPWRLHHFGIQFTMHELLQSGVSFSETLTGVDASRSSRAEKIRLADLLDDKVEDMKEGGDRGMNEIFWRDGTQDAKVLPGVKSFIVDDPTAVANVAGLPQNTLTWWRNRSSINITLGSGPETQAVIKTLQYEVRQLRRFGGNPTVGLCGSDFLQRMEDEIRAKGNYTETGFAKNGKLDASVADLEFKGIELEYDPTLDDLGEAKRCYLMDMKTIKPMYIDGENMKDHAPARPENKYVFYRARTWVGGLVCTQRNANGVYGFA